jgi:hypothetical protein
MIYVMACVVVQSATSNFEQMCYLLQQQQQQQQVAVNCIEVYRLTVDLYIFE